LRNIVVFLVFVILLIVGFTFCRSLTAPADMVQAPTPTLAVGPPIPTFTPEPLAPLPTATPEVQPEVQPQPPAVAPIVEVELAENSEWYIDGWAEDAVVVNQYGREMRFDLAEFRNVHTNAPIVVMCIEPEALQPNVDFTLPVEQRARFVYKGYQFWHVTDPAVQRFVFVRAGELP
jgi:hypothetical protein